MSTATVKRFSTPSPRAGKPEAFEIEVVRHITEPVTVKVDGKPTAKLDKDGTPVTRTVEKRDVVTFHAKPDISGGGAVQLELMGKPGAHGRGSDALFEFFDAALVEEDRQRFTDLIRDPGVFVHIKTLGEIAVWLYQAAAEREDRPTTEV